MRLFISHETALTYWREHFPLDSELGRPTKVSAAESQAFQKADILALMPESWIVPDRPVDVLLFNQEARRRSQKVSSHLWSLPLPDGAFYRDGDVCVSSPEFTFLQMASRLSIIQLIALGCELCGTYVQVPRNRQHPGAIDDFPKRVVPLTNIEKLEAFVAASEGAQGVRKARRALRYIAEGARSPMESMTYLLLCLPPLLGGYGLPKATLNPLISLDEEAQSIALRRHAVGDICWIEEKLDVEYQGEIHSGAQKMREDAGREIGIESMGWRVIAVTSAQVLDGEQFGAVAKEAAKYLKRRLYPRVLDDSLSARHVLREELESWFFAPAV